MTEHFRVSPDRRYEEISRSPLEQARQERENQDILQASEKVWDATSHAIKDYPKHYPVGIKHVNGQVVIQQGENTGVLPGRALRRGRGSTKEWGQC